jgi:hypothetical protein
MKKWIAYAAYRCEVAGFASDTIDIQCRYFEFADENDIDPALKALPNHTYKNENGETVTWIYVKCLIIWDFDRMPKHGKEFGGVHIDAHQIRNLTIKQNKQVPANLHQIEPHQKLSVEDIHICTQALNEVCHGPDAIEEWEFHTRMGCFKSEAIALINSLEYIGHNAYQNRQLTHQHVFVLHHEHHMADDRDNAKLLGVYATHEAAQQQIDTHYKLQPGFNQADGEFSIDSYEIGKSHWLEGFITETYHLKTK